MFLTKPFAGLARIGDGEIAAYRSQTTNRRWQPAFPFAFLAVQVLRLAFPALLVELLDAAILQLFALPKHKMRAIAANSWRPFV